jgi:hypothetical protein
MHTLHRLNKAKSKRQKYSQEILLPFSPSQRADSQPSAQENSFIFYLFITTSIGGDSGWLLAVSSPCGQQGENGRRPTRFI